MTRRTAAILFGLVVALCLAQIGWWIYFQVRETRTLERAAQLLQEGQADAAAQTLGADASGSLADSARRRRVMFISEGATLGVLVLIGVVFFYTRMLRELRMRHAQERFLAGATHELKTPLATLRLGLQSLQQERVPAAKRRAYLETMVREVGRLEADVANLLTAAGLTEKEPPLRRVDGALDDDLRDAVDEFRPRFDDAGIDLQLEIADRLVLGRDPQALRVVVRNLLDNALKYCHPGDRVGVTLRATAPFAEVRVTDTGPGIAQNELPHLFRRFYRGQTQTHTGGTGLGLYLVQQLVQAHGGTVDARSDGPGRGTEFCVRLPLSGAAS